MKIELLKKCRSLLGKGIAPLWAGFAFGLSATTAVAQEQETQVAPGAIEEVVVTGSRLRTNPNVYAANPVLTISQEEVDIRGTARIEDLTNQLPQVFAGQASEVSNGATGTGTLNLRGLGSIRTLVLIDGRRMPFGNSQTSPPDLNLVPTQLVERVEIVTGGASAVYGSDAIAGVANFILKDDFEGVDFEVQGAFNQYGNSDTLFENVLDAAEVDDPGSTTDGGEIRASLTMGANSADGRGNITMFLNYENVNAITQAGRDFSACALGASGGPNSFEGIGCVGSSNFRRFFGLATGIDRFQEESGTLVPFAGGPAQTFNFGPFNFFQRPIERFQFYTKGHYDITDDIEFFADLSFLNTSSDAQIAPSASFGFWETNCDNPLLQTQQPMTLAEVFGCVPDPDTGEIPDEVPIFASHRMVEGGPRNSNIDLTNWNMSGGFRGTLVEAVDFEVFGQFAQTSDKFISTNDLVIDNVQDAFFVVEDENGNPVCRSGNPGCVPFNIFERNPDGTTRVTDEAREFVEGIGITTGEVRQWAFGGNVQTDLGRFGIQSPMADSGMGFLVGGEFREDQLVSEPDQISQQPDGGFTGVGGPTLPVSGEVRVGEVYLESQLPLISGQPFIEQLAIGGAYRFSDYTTEDEDTENSFDTDTWHVFVNWTPVEDIRIRGQFQRAVRAPNVIELFTPQGTNLPNLTIGPNGFFDPCAGPNPAASLEQCARSGVTQGQFGSIPDVISGQTQSITGGNPFLLPEESDTFTFGLILTPRAVPELSISVDYFDIEVDSAIQAGIPAQTTLDECLETGNAAFCDLITRDVLGSLIAGTPGVGFQQTNINIGALETNGIDVQIIYDLNLSDIGLDTMGSVRFDFAATYLDALDEIPFPGANPIECAGKVTGSCGSPNPEYRHRMLVTWNTPWDITANATWRFFSETDNQVGPDVQPFIDRKAETTQYLDLSVGYDMENISIRGGVNNLFGNQPPVIASAGPALGNGNTFPTVYDTGRFIFFTANYRL